MLCVHCAALKPKFLITQTFEFFGFVLPHKFKSKINTPLKLVPEVQLLRDKDEDSKRARGITCQFINY